jgi:hypothetical protein
MPLDLLPRPGRVDLSRLGRIDLTGDRQGGDEEYA